MYDRNELLSQIAAMYYESELTQTEIAKKLGISRPTIAEMLKEARKNGVVKIYVNYPSNEMLDIESAISKKYNLEFVKVIKSSNDVQYTKKNLGEICAAYLSNFIEDGNSIGIGWGSTIHEVVHAMPYLKKSNTSIVPLIGGVGIDDIYVHSNHLAFELAQKLNCSANYFYAPAIADQPEMKTMLENSEFIKSIYKLGKHTNLAILSVGNPIFESTLYKLGYISEQEANDINNKGSIGDILTTQLNEDGLPIESELSKKMIGLNIDDLTHIDDILIVACGIKKTKIIRTLLDKNFITRLFIDSNIAHGLIGDYSNTTF